MRPLVQYYLQPGYIYAAREGTAIKTVLGSCIAVCLWDQRLGFGGMNHFIYPRRRQQRASSEYGDIATPYLIRLMTRLGSKKGDLVAHVVGGAVNPLITSDIGLENIKVADEVLGKQRIKIVTRDTGGTTGKKIIFNTANGDLFIYRCIQSRESDYYGRN